MKVTWERGCLCWCGSPVAEVGDEGRLRARRPNIDVLGDICEAAEDDVVGAGIDAGCAGVLDDEWPGRRVLLRDESGFNELGK